MAQKLHGLKAKLYAEQRRKEKIQMKKTQLSNAESKKTHKDDSAIPDGAVPAYLLEREGQNSAKILSNTIKQKRKEKAGKWDVPIPKVNPITEDQLFRVITTGKRGKKSWKRLITMPTFVGQGYTRKAPKYERFIRPAALRFRKAQVTHPELKATFTCDILGVKKNPSSHLFTELGVLTKGSIIEVNVADLGLVTASGKIVFGKYAQISNNPERDGVVNAILLT